MNRGWPAPPTLAPPPPAPPRPAYTPDRQLTVPRGAIVRTAYLDVFSIRPACRERMAVGDVDRAFQKLLQLGDEQAFPCPNGEWHGNDFILLDGRHEWLASIMLGKTHILVAWLEAR